MICGPAGYSDGSIADARGKGCNVFHGDYGLAVGPDDAIYVVWTGLNRLATSPQLDFYIGGQHDGYAQDAMFRVRDEPAQVRPRFPATVRARDGRGEDPDPLA